MKIAIGCDHAGLQLKEKIKELLLRFGMEILDYGTTDGCSVDYPDYGERVSDAVSSGEVERGILICGTGLGMSIVANKFPGVRATLCHDSFTARMGRLHNDSNILVLGARTTDGDIASEIVRIWIETPFEGERHSRRLEKISIIEARLNEKGRE
ncbi:MAG TPA: ribose 5-phosphate isomerase B [Nitrospirae bacterium]|nr:ribose 5-phosphate isomerase B [Nitrospirota bacterium]